MGIAELKAILDLPQNSDLNNDDLGFSKLLEGIVSSEPDEEQLEQLLTAILEKDGKLELSGIKLNKDWDSAVLELMEGFIDSTNREETVKDEEAVPWDAFVNIASASNLPQEIPVSLDTADSKQLTNVISRKLSLVDNIWYNKPVNENLLNVAAKQLEQAPMEAGFISMEEVQHLETDKIGLGLSDVEEVGLEVSSAVGLDDDQFPPKLIESSKETSVNLKPFNANELSAESRADQQVVPANHGLSFNHGLEPEQSEASAYDLRFTLDGRTPNDQVQGFQFLADDSLHVVQRQDLVDNNISLQYEPQLVANEHLESIRSDQFSKSEMKVNQLTNNSQEVISVNAFKGLASDDLDSSKENGEQLDTSMLNIGEHPDIVTNSDNDFQVVSSTLRNQSLEESVFNQIIDRMQYQADGDYHEIRIQLKPDHLGDVKIKLAMEQGIVTAEFVMENQVVKEILASQLPDLRQSMQELGMQLGQVDVSLNNNSGQREESFQPRTQVGKAKVNRQIKMDIQGSLNSIDSLSQVNLRV